MKRVVIRKNWSMGKIVFNLLGAGIAIGSLIAVAWFAFQAPHSNISFEETQWTFFIASILVQLTGLLVMPLLWYSLLRFIWESPGNELSPHNLLRLYTSYSRSWLARYIPGRIWMFGGRILFATKIGIPSETIIRGIAIETFLVYGSITTIGAGLFLSARFHYSLGLLALVLGLAALGAGIPLSQRILAVRKLSGDSDSLWHRATRFVYRIILGDKLLPLRDSFQAVILYGFLACSQLAFIVLLAESFVDLTLGQALTIAGAWGFSTTLGYFTFIAPGPGGLGVRDGIALFFFSQVIDLPTAALIVGVARVIMVLTDVAFVSIIEAVVIIGRIGQRIPGSSVKIKTT